MAKTKKTDKEAELERSRKTAERTREQAEKGTGDQRGAGYAGSGDYANPQNFNTDPGQADADQLREDRQRQREGGA